MEKKETESTLRSEFVREPGRLDRSIDTRQHDGFYESEVDFDRFDYDGFDGRKLNLLAPPPRIDEKHGKMRQFWAAYKMNNGRRIQQLKAQGYSIRRPETVPVAYAGLTEQWSGGDVIMVGNEHILMEVPESHWIKVRKAKHESNNQIIRDIKESHGTVQRVDVHEVQVLRDANAPRFHSVTQAAGNQDSEGSITFDA